MIAVEKFFIALITGLVVCGSIFMYYTQGSAVHGGYVAEYDKDKSSVSVKNVTDEYYMYEDCSIWFDIDSGAAGQGYDSIKDVPDEEVRNILSDMAHDFMPYCVAE